MIFLRIFDRRPPGYTGYRVPKLFQTHLFRSHLPKVVSVPISRLDFTMLLIGLTLASLPLLSIAALSGPKVTTTYGTWVGANKGGVEAFLGIPYAQVRLSPTP